MKLRKILCFAIALSVCMPLLLLPSSGDDPNAIGDMVLYDYYEPYNLTHSLFVPFDLAWYNFYERTNYAASSIYNALSTDEIIIVEPADSGPGYITAYTGNLTHLCADTYNNHYYGGSDVAIGNTNGTRPKQNLLTVYFGDYTGTTPNPVADPSSITGYIYPANLITATYAMHSKCAIGWTSNLPEDLFAEWCTHFARGICYKYKVNNVYYARTISQGLDFAYDELDAAGFSDVIEPIAALMIRGDSSLVVVD